MGRGSTSDIKPKGSQLHSKSKRTKMSSQNRGGRGHGHRGRGGGGSRGYGRGRGGGGYSGGGGGWRQKLHEDMSGFLCTSSINEKDCAKEALNLLNEYVCDDDFKTGTANDTPVDTDTTTDPESIEPPSAQEDEDLESSLKAEVNELKSEVVRNRFFCIDTGVPNLIFVKSTVQDPSALAYRIFEDVTATKQLKARFLLRLVPIEVTCKAYMDQIDRTARLIFPKYFGQNFTSFQILFKSRYNNNIERTEVIKVLAALVCEINPLNVVDLTNPTYSIVVEVIRNIVCLGVVKDYNRFKKFNLHEVVGEKSEDQDTTGYVDCCCEPKPVKIKNPATEVSQASAAADVVVATPAPTLDSD